MAGTDVSSGTGAAANPTLGLLGRLVDRFTDIVGDGPSYATFHYASQQEGGRLGEATQPADLSQVLRRIDGILGHKTVLLLATPDEVVLDVADSPLLAAKGQAGQGIVLGLLEGLLKAVLKKPFVGTVEPGPPPHATLRFKAQVPP